MAKWTKFGYDKVMLEPDIKSPLPPRRFASVDPVATPPEPALTPNPEIKTETTETQSNYQSKPGLPVKMSHGLNIVVPAIVIGLILAILFLIFRVLLPGIKGGGVNKVVINYWGLWEEPAVIQGIIADYEAKNPNVKINYVRNQKTNYRTRLQARLESGASKDDNPDIFRYHSTWVPMLKNSLAKVPAETANSIGLDNDFYDTYKGTIKIGGSWLGVPLMYDGLSLFYNKDLLDSAQVAVPKSWWDLGMAANKLTVRDESGKIKIAGAALGLVDNVDHWSDILGLMLKQGGVDVLADDADNNKKLTDVLTFYTLFRSKDHVWDEILSPSTEMFANGKLAFYFGPSWRVFNIEEMKKGVLNYEITTVPQLPTLNDVPPDQVNNEANLTNIHWGSYWVEGVSPNSKNQKEAWKFLTYLSTKENMEKMYTAASQIREFGEIYPRKSMKTNMMANPKTKPFVNAADNATSWYLASRTDDAGLNEEMSKYFGDAINSIVLNNATPESVLPTLRSGINQLVTKYKLK